MLDKRNFFLVIFPFLFFSFFSNFFHTCKKNSFVLKYVNKHNHKYHDYLACSWFNNLGNTSLNSQMNFNTLFVLPEFVSIFQEYFKTSIYSVSFIPRAPPEII